MPSALDGGVIHEASWLGSPFRAVPPEVDHVSDLQTGALYLFFASQPR